MLKYATTNRSSSSLTKQKTITNYITTTIMTNQKEYTIIVSPDDKKKRGVSFRILSGIAATVALSSGGYALLHSNNDNSPQGLSLTTNVLRSSGSHSSAGCRYEFVDGVSGRRGKFGVNRGRNVLQKIPIP